MLGNDLLSRRVTPAVPSALEGLTSVFGKGTGVSPPPLSPNIGIIPASRARPRSRPAVGHPRFRLAGSAPAGAQALDLPCFSGGNVVRTPSHLSHEPLFLHLAAELAQRLL